MASSKYYKKAGALWLSFSIFCTCSFGAVDTYYHHRNDSNKNLTQQDVQKIANKLLFSYNFLPPNKKGVEVTIVNLDIWNAFCSVEVVSNDPVIRVSVYQGLLDETKNIDELAYVIGHEIAHSLLGHTRHDAVYDESSINAEAAADIAGQQLVRIAGYDPGYAADVWQRQYDNDGGDPIPTTHPKYSDRVRILKQSKFWYNELFELTFRYGKYLSGLVKENAKGYPFYPNVQVSDE